MNLSERIRECLTEPKTAHEVHNSIGGCVKLIRGCIQTMVKVGIAERIGEKRPYKYKVKRMLYRNWKLEGNLMVKSKAKLIREFLQANGPSTNSQVSDGMSMPPKDTSKALFDMRSRGYIDRDDDGRFFYVCEPNEIPRRTLAEMRAANAQSAQRMREKKRRDNEIKAASARKSSMPSMDFRSHQQPVVKAQTVEEFLANGGKIDYSDTVVKFERLTHEEIMANAGKSAIGHTHQPHAVFSSHR